MEIEGQCKNSGLNLPKQNQISFQNHIELVYPFKLQSLVGMEDFSTMWSSWILIQSNHESIAKLHYNKRYPCMSSDYTRFWMNSLVVVNKDQWRSSEFIGLVNRD